ncbi:MAG TPA: NADH-quinone oxidoreductase subunit J, partial [Gemmataceae bacterium]
TENKLAISMTLPGVLFTILAAVVAFSALGVVLSQNIVRSAVWLLFTLIGVSFLYFLLGAEFVGAAQLIVYVGGTLVLVIFGVMLTAQLPFLRLKTRAAEWAVSGALGLGLFALLAYASLQLGQTADPEQVPPEQLPGVDRIGLAFLGVGEATPEARLGGFPEGETPPARERLGYLLPFEIVSVHLLVVLIGAAYLARAKRRPPQTAPPAEGAFPS